MKRAKISQKKLLTAIKGTGGIVSAIAQRLGVDWHTARNAIDRFPAARQAWDDERETLLDLAETKIIDSIRNGDTNDAKWVLSRLGRERGYGEKIEADGAITLRVIREDGAPHA